MFSKVSKRLSFLMTITLAAFFIQVVEHGFRALRSSFLYLVVKHG